MVEQFDMKILYVDYLQLIESNNRRGSRAEDVAAVSRGLKLIAMENNIPVVALSQFNRGAIQADVTDLLSHLKESSGLEQDASTVSYIQINNADPLAKIKSAKFQVLKNRNGVTFKPVMLDYTGETFTFNEGIQ
jgi:replicative DNA helicase